MSRTYRVPSSNLFRLECELSAINKRAAKLHLDPVSFSIVREETVEKKTDYGTTVRRFFHIEVSGGR